MNKHMPIASESRTAILYRMVMLGHICPWGVKALHLLKSKGFTVEDHPLTTPEATEAYKAEHNVNDRVRSIGG